MKRNFLTLAAIALVALVACGSANYSVKPQTVAGNAGDPGLAYAPPALPADGLRLSTGEGYYAPPETVVDQEAPNTQANSDRLVIKNANLSIVVDDPVKTVDAITQMVEGLGGFVVSSNVYQTTYGSEAQTARQASMILRVPSEALNQALAQLKGMAVEVKTESLSGQDVTSEYTDLKSRLTNLEAAERQLQSIMEEATKTQDVLTVYQQLVSTREQIEVIKGQMKYYEQSAAMSAITLEIIPNVVTQPIEVGGWHPEGIAKEAIEDTVRFLQSATDGLIYFGIARLPFLVIFGVPALLIGRWLLRRTKKNAVKPAQAGTD